MIDRASFGHLGASILHHSGLPGIALVLVLGVANSSLEIDYIIYFSFDRFLNFDHFGV